MMDSTGGPLQRLVVAKGGWLRCALALGVLALPGARPLARAQYFEFTQLDAPATVLLGSNIFYSVTVQNVTADNFGAGAITSVYDTNLAELVQATSDYNIVTNPGLVRFEFPLNTLPAGGKIAVSLELRAVTVGDLTNRFVAATDDGLTVPAAVEVVTAIVSPPEADLRVAFVGPPHAIFPGDRFEYQLLATNAGPDSVDGVTVESWFPRDVDLTRLDPADALTLSSNLLLFSVGTLTNGGSATATVSVLATNVAPSNLISATILAPLVDDPDFKNNIAFKNVAIHEPDTNQLRVTAVTGQQLNLQTGWMEQRVNVTNTGPTGVASVRLLVAGLTNPLVALVNASGTNWSTPYVAHGAPLAGHETVELTLEYWSPSRQTNAVDPSWQAYGTPALILTPQAGERVVPIRFLPILAGPATLDRILLEWSVTNGGRYQVVYDEGPDFPSPKASQPVVTPPTGADRVQWLDYGPPRTLAAPSNSAARFYKVIALP